MKMSKVLTLTTATYLKKITEFQSYVVVTKKEFISITVGFKIKHAQIKVY